MPSSVESAPVVVAVAPVSVVGSSVVAALASVAADAGTSRPAIYRRWPDKESLVVDAIDAVERNGAAALALVSLVASLQLAYPRRPGTPPPIVVMRR